MTKPNEKTYRVDYRLYGATARGSRVVKARTPKAAADAATAELAGTNKRAVVLNVWRLELVGQEVTTNVLMPVGAL
jgi:hypothetical protein